MNKPQTKADFINTLNKELLNFGVIDTSEILSDFELHFDNSSAEGTSEADICEKLGDVSEIAAQYRDDYTGPDEKVIIPATPDIPVVSIDIPEKESPLVLDTFSEIEDIIAAAPAHPKTDIPTETIQETLPPPEPAVNTINTQYTPPNGINAGGLVKVLIIDLLILSWVLPSLFSVVLALLTIPISLITTGIASIFGGALSGFANFHSPFSSLSNIFLGIAVLALGGLSVLLGIKLVMLCVKIVKGIINWHSISITGRKIFLKKEGQNI